MLSFLFEDISIFLPVILLGLCLGSFATAIIWRSERGLSWISQDKSPARSACPSCGAQLGARDLVPFFSWLFLRGRCRFCSKPIPVFYPLTELSVAGFTFVLFWVWGAFAPVWPLLLAVPFLVAALVIDWRHMILPDDINAALFMLSVLHAGLIWWQADWDWMVATDRVLAAIILTGVFFAVGQIMSRWKKREALGMGDIKFLPSAGLFLGMAAIPSYMILSGALGVVLALMKGKNGGTGPFPFGPALIAALYLHLILTGLGFDYSW